MMGGILEECLNRSRWNSVDAPCTGTATTRKNRGLWSKWTQKKVVLYSDYRPISHLGLRKCFGLGGRMVYSTCSLDPLENEAVVCEILRRCPWLELINIDAQRLFPGLKAHRGMSAIGKFLMKMLTSLNGRASCQGYPAFQKICSTLNRGAKKHQCYHTRLEYINMTTTPVDSMLLYSNMLQSVPGRCRSFNDIEA